MDALKLINELKKNYEIGRKNNQAMTMIHLFGIKFAKELEGKPVSFLKDLSTYATGKASFATEIRKGMNLSKYVTLK